MQMRMCISYDGRSYTDPTLSHRRHGAVPPSVRHILPHWSTNFSTPVPRGRTEHRKGRGWLGKLIEENCSKDTSDTHRTSPDEVYSALKGIFSPFSSNEQDISKVASTEAIKIHNVVSAKCRPGHFLQIELIDLLQNTIRAYTPCPKAKCAINARVAEEFSVR
jgi:hypothetical protein